MKMLIIIYCLKLQRQFLTYYDLIIVIIVIVFILL